jgi:hypothetical protein
VIGVCGAVHDRDRNAAAGADASPEQGRWLKQVVSGYFNYHTVPTNTRALDDVFRSGVTKRWWQVLRRRSEKTTLTWVRMAKLADDWLPKPRTLHPWPNQRFVPSLTRGKSRMRNVAFAVMWRSRLGVVDGNGICFPNATLQIDRC